MVHRDRIGKRNWQIIFKYELDSGHTASPFNASLRAIWWGGREKEAELATTSLEFEFRLQFNCGSPSTKLSDFCQSARSGNERECKQTFKKHLKARATGDDVIANVISVN